MILKSPVISKQCTGITFSTPLIKEVWLLFKAYTPHTVTSSAWLVLIVVIKSYFLDLWLPLI